MRKNGLNERAFDFLDDQLVQIVRRGRAHVFQILFYRLLDMLIQTGRFAGGLRFQGGSGFRLVEPPRPKRTDGREKIAQPS